MPSKDKKEPTKKPAKEIIPIEIEDKMRQSYLAYAMSVIVGRALPDVKDGLKPVHRRILYAMNERAWRHDRPYVKSAKIVGEVIGNFHPHGDVAVYDTMVRMAQDFSMRVELIDGQGNLGSIDGDPPAAYRYTEARLTTMSEQLLKDIDKDTVDFEPNFDGSRREPVVLPSSWPNLLVNGSSGIAVGMATKIPPHNLREVIDALEYLIQKPDATIKELMKKLPAPDFPTGGIIIGKEGLKQAYSTGKGSITIRSVAEIEETSKNKNTIIVKEIPYEVKKSDLIIKIAELVSNKKIEGISDIRDESDRNGMRIVITIRKNANPKVILNQLFKRSSMQVSYGIILLALVNREPKLLNLKEILTNYLDHRNVIITRRTKYELDQAEKRAHILEGLKIALDFIDEVIKIIRSSQTIKIAQNSLMKRFDLTEIQANAILEMRLQKLTSLESKKIIEELTDLKKKIKDLKDILSKKSRIIKIVEDELIEIKERLGTKRKSILDEGDIESIALDSEDLIANQEEVITLSEANYIRRVPLDIFKRQQRGGRGVISGGKKEDTLKHVLFCRSHDFILFFSNKGKVFYQKSHMLEQMGKDSRGRHVSGLLSLAKEEYITTMASTGYFKEGIFLILVTKAGIIKKLELKQIQNAKKSGMLALQFKGNVQDHLVDVVIVDNDQDIFLASSAGVGFRTPSNRMRPQGRSASGVLGMNLSKGNYLVGINRIDRNSQQLFVITEKGYGKRVPYSEFASKGRGGKGMIFCKVNERVGNVVAVHSVNEDNEAIVTTKFGMTLRFFMKSISLHKGRGTSGVKVVNLVENDLVADIAIL